MTLPQRIWIQGVQYIPEPLIKQHMLTLYKQFALDAMTWVVCAFLYGALLSYYANKHHRPWIFLLGTALPVLWLLIQLRHYIA